MHHILENKKEIIFTFVAAVILLSVPLVIKTVLLLGFLSLTLHALVNSYIRYGMTLNTTIKIQLMSLVVVIFAASSSLNRVIETIVVDRMAQVLTFEETQ